MPQYLLQRYFPLIRTRYEVENTIRNTPSLEALFESWDSDQQQEFLDFCSGERGVKILYDSFFKEIFNPEYCPQRLEALLSTILKQNPENRLSVSRTAQCLLFCRPAPAPIQTPQG